MRRRLLLGESINYVFSAKTTSISVSDTSGSTSINIKSTANGENTPYVVYSYNGCVTAVTTAATSVTIRYSGNTTLSSKSGTVVLKQNDSNKIITINITQAQAVFGVYENAFTIDAANGSTGYVRTNVTDSGTVASKPSWVDVTYSSNGIINVTATSANNSSTCRTGTTTIEISGNTASIPIIQLPSSYSSVDGHEYVTIGSLKWARKNINASSITAYGTYYNSYDSVDRVTENMGGDWRMPTMDELRALTGNTRYFSFYNNVHGIVYYSSSANQCVYFPCTGYYSYVGDGVRDLGSKIYIWSSTAEDSINQYSLYAYKTFNTVAGYHKRCKMPLRGVHA